MKLPRLYAILDADIASRAGWTPRDLAAAYVQGGARFLQIRAKHAPSGWLLDLAETVVTMGRSIGALVVVNDRADVARLADASGVHLGQDDLAPAAARGIVGAECLIGLSTHTVGQLDAAVLEPIDYVAIGPVFGTVSKATGYDAVGLPLVREAAARARRRGIPLVAIGGITLDRAADVLDAGADAIAVISDLMSTGDPEVRVRDYLARLAELSHGCYP